MRTSILFFIIDSILFIYAPTQKQWSVNTIELYRDLLTTIDFPVIFFFLSNLGLLTTSLFESSVLISSPRSQLGKRRHFLVSFSLVGKASKVFDACVAADSVLSLCRLQGIGGGGSSRTFLPLAIRKQVLDASSALPSTPSQTWLLEHASSTEDALICKYCGKVFAGRNRQQRMQFHALTHTGEKPHPCPYCPYRARLKYNLKKHVRTMHRDVLDNWITEAELATGNGEASGVHLGALERFAVINSAAEDNTAASLLPGLGTMVGSGVSSVSGAGDGAFGGVSDHLLRGVWGGGDSKGLQQDGGALHRWEVASVPTTNVEERQ